MATNKKAVMFSWCVYVTDYSIL